ncbi:hypothetical protein F511_32785 [Dorcoceras hygrometricum]|uniref:Uncharacterized protein n=1 Tax=Dorcoceras hygrometricum TaxID=472368 RepID=A0A2Z7BYH9_9LAMI|nr:hypothetical protein F511_32785 [Dorcoceras hygrometricum]
MILGITRDVAPTGHSLAGRCPPTLRAGCATLGATCAALGAAARGLVPHAMVSAAAAVRPPSGESPASLRRLNFCF